MNTVNTPLHIKALTVILESKREYIKLLNDSIMTLLLDLEQDAETRNMRTCEHAGYAALNSELTRARKHVANLEATLNTENA